jgi:choline dehydrogenase-like flavoprotein
MHIDARQLDDNSVIEGDVCIIGAGAAGISIALEWMNTSFKVILLEGGGFEYDDKVQELYRGKTTGQRYYPLKSSRLHYFGGTTGHWGGGCSVFDPISFQKRDWVDYSGWPFTDKDLVPFYKRAHVNLDLGIYEFNLNYWQKKNPELIPLLPNEDVFWNKLWRYSPPTRFGEKYKDTIVNAKNIHLYTYANVVDIQANENVSLINEVTVKNYARKKHKVKARYFILACCSIQNARLLLAANKQSPKGLGNDNDLVGRYFMEHAEVKAAELWLNELNALKLYMRTPPNIKTELAMTATKQAEYRILNGIVSFTPLTLARKIPPMIESWTKDDPREAMEYERIVYTIASGSRISRFFDSNKDKAYELIVRMEQSPNPLSRVTLDTEKDELGVPRAILNWAFTSLEKKSLRKIFEVLGQQVGLAGIGRIRLKEELQDERDESMPSSTSGGWHHMGTTRMNEDPKQGVVDANCKIHGIDNLFAAGSSCYPTGGAVNPTLTLVALSLRLSDHLKEKISNQAPV